MRFVCVLPPRSRREQTEHDEEFSACVRTVGMEISETSCGSIDLDGKTLNSRTGEESRVSDTIVSGAGARELPGHVSRRARPT